MGPCLLLKMKKIWWFQYLHVNIKKQCQYKETAKALKKMEKRGLQPSSPAEGVHGNRTKISLCFRGVMHQRWGCTWVRQLCKTHSPALRYSPKCLCASPEGKRVYLCLLLGKLIPSRMSDTTNLTVNKLTGNIFGNSFKLSVSSERTKHVRGKKSIHKKVF